MRRQCGRPGCSAPATVTFTFDATRCVVWLNPMADGTPRAGDLCTRHADGLVPPQGWQRIDRRPTGADAPGISPAPEVGPSENVRANANAAVNAAPSIHAGPVQAPPSVAPVQAAPIAPHRARLTATALIPGATAGPGIPETPVRPGPARGDDLLPQRRKRRKRWSEVPSLFDPADGSDDSEIDDSAHLDGFDVFDAERPAEPEVAGVAAPTPEPAPAPEHRQPSWLPRLASNDDLDGVLDADTPLLSRAFRSARPMNESVAEDESSETDVDAADETEADAGE